MQVIWNKVSAAITWVWNNLVLITLVSLAVGAFVWGHLYPYKPYVPPVSDADVPLPATFIVSGTEILSPSKKIELTVLAPDKDNKLVPQEEVYQATVQQITYGTQHEAKTVVLRLPDDKAKKLREFIGTPNTRFVFSLFYPPTPTPQEPLPTSPPATPVEPSSS